MNFLADTHVLIWWITGDAQLTKRVKTMIFARDANLWVSAASVWEMSIKASKERLKLHDNLALKDIIPMLFEEGCRPLPINTEHALAVGTLPLLHGDPFDRMLVAQALCKGLTIVTVDPKISAYGIPTVDAST